LIIFFKFEQLEPKIIIKNTLSMDLQTFRIIVFSFMAIALAVTTMGLYVLRAQRVRHMKELKKLRKEIKENPNANIKIK